MTLTNRIVGDTLRKLRIADDEIDRLIEANRQRLIESGIVMQGGKQVAVQFVKISIIPSYYRYVYVFVLLYEIKNEVKSGF